MRKKATRPGHRRLRRGDPARSNNADAFINRGLVHYAKKGHDRAIADYSEAIRLDPNNSMPFNNRGLVHYGKKGQPTGLLPTTTRQSSSIRRTQSPLTTGAMLMRKKATPTGPSPTTTRRSGSIQVMPNAFTTGAMLMRAKGDTDRAIADYSEAIRLKPDYARAFCNRGIAKLKINDATGNQDKAKARELERFGLPMRSRVVRMSDDPTCRIMSAPGSSLVDIFTGPR